MTIKFYLLALLTVICADFITIYSKSIVEKLLSPSPEIFNNTIIFCVSVSIFLSLYGILLLTINGRTQILIFYTLLILSLLVSVFIEYDYLELIVNPVLIAGTLALIHINYQKEILNQIKINTRVISNHTFAFVLCVAIIISINFFLINNKGNNENMFQNMKNYLINTSTFYIENMIGKSISTENAKIMGIDISQFQIDPTISQMIKEQESSMKMNVKNQVSTEVSKILDPYESYFNPVATGVIFLTVVSLAPIIRYLTFLFSTIMFWVFKRSKFINETTEMIEVIRYKL